MNMNNNLYLLVERMKESKGKIEDRLLEYHKNSNEVRSLKRTTHLMNVTHVISYDIYLGIVHLIKTSSRRKIES